jgi:hypothetical protein
MNENKSACPPLYARLKASLEEAEQWMRENADTLTTERADTIRAIQEASKDIEDGNLMDAREALDTLRKKHGLKK